MLKLLLKGIPGSSGKTSGKVRILLSPDDTSKMKEGDILVARETTPAYTFAIFKARAIVTDLGGILSHPAIVAREKGIPAVVGTFKATQVLRDGMEVIVDGTKGVVLKKGR